MEKKSNNNIFLFISFFLQNIFLQKQKSSLKLILKQGTKRDKLETFELVMLIFIFEIDHIFIFVDITSIN